MTTNGSAFPVPPSAFETGYADGLVAATMAVEEVLLDALHEHDPEWVATLIEDVRQRLQERGRSPHPAPPVPKGVPLFDLPPGNPDAWSPQEFAQYLAFVERLRPPRRTPPPNEDGSFTMPPHVAKFFDKEIRPVLAAGEVYRFPPKAAPLPLYRAGQGRDREIRPEDVLPDPGRPGLIRRLLACLRPLRAKK